MFKSIKLVCVSDINNNKFYNMDLLPSGEIKVHYGRVGYEGNVKIYPGGERSWDALYRSKLKKGYKDISDLKVEIKTVNQDNSFSGINSQVSSFLSYIMKCSKEKVSGNYLVTSDQVTQNQINKAQELIDKTVPLIDKGKSVSQLNSTLMELYTVIPRKMKNVKLFLIDSLNSEHDLDQARRLIDNEQSLLSTLESQIVSTIQTSTSSNKNILEEMGVLLEVETDQTMLNKINAFLGQNVSLAKNIFKVTNKYTQGRYDTFLANAKNKTTGLLWHGSRNENWLGIIQKGLLIRPANAIITGAMFGNGLYFANKSQKSIGYTSLDGSYWTTGGSKTGFISLFSVHMGKSKDVTSSDSRLHIEAQQGKWDSVFAHAGSSLRNDEIIVYKTEQATISYIIELKK